MLVSLTGGTGFVGRHIAATLLGRGHRVRALVRNPARAGFLAARGGSVELVPGDVRDSGALDRLVHGADAVIHLVGIIVERGAETFTAIHVDGTAGVLAAARRAGVARVVHMSALGARDEPGATAYHRTKWQAEELVRRSGVSYATFRPSIINGPESVPLRVLVRLHRWLPVVPVFGDGGFPTQPVWVGDVALAFALAAERSDLAGEFELGGPQVLTYEELLLAVGRVSGHSRPLIHIPLGAARAATGLLDWLGPTAPITRDQLQMLAEGSATPHNAITTVFQIEPLSFEAGLKRWL